MSVLIHARIEKVNCEKELTKVYEAAGSLYLITCCLDTPNAHL
jgi:hypothetical protein